MQQPENGGSLETQVPKDDAPTGFSFFITFIELLNVGFSLSLFSCYDNFNIALL
jgi:hypothetical protein